MRGKAGGGTYFSKRPMFFVGVTAGTFAQCSEALANVPFRLLLTEVLM